MTQVPASGGQPPPADADPEARRPGAGELIVATPGLIRVAAGVWWRTAGWTAGASARAGARLVRAATSGESSGEVLEEVSAAVRDSARRLLGLIADEPDDAAGREAGAARNGGAGTIGDDASAAPLRRQGEELLRRSADVEYREEFHPAYARILDELAPDEARILRLLALEGPQPTVDVRADKLPYLSSHLVVGGLSMIGPAAGVRFLPRVPAYLNNLYRLGLIWFSRESLADPLRYQVLEAQPDVAEALKQAGRGRTVRRSIHLTPFGEDFCQTCLPLGTGEIEALGGEVAEGSGIGGAGEFASGA